MYQQTMGNLEDLPTIDEEVALMQSNTKGVASDGDAAPGTGTKKVSAVMNNSSNSHSLVGPLSCDFSHACLRM